MTVMCPDAFPVEKLQLGRWSGELGHMAVSSGQSHRQLSCLWAEKDRASLQVGFWEHWALRCHSEANVG